MERRLQVLLDAERYERLAAEADRTGRSVAAIVREAIDLRFPGGSGDPHAALDALLKMTATPGDQPGDGPAEMKAAYGVSLDAKLDRS